MMKTCSHMDMAEWRTICVSTVFHILPVTTVYTLIHVLQYVLVLQYVNMYTGGYAPYSAYSQYLVPSMYFTYTGSVLSQPKHVLAHDNTNTHMTLGQHDTQVVLGAHLASQQHTEVHTNVVYTRWQERGTHQLTHPTPPNVQLYTATDHASKSDANTCMHCDLLTVTCKSQLWAD